MAINPRGWVVTDKNCRHCHQPLALVKAGNQVLHNRCRPEYERLRNAERAKLRNAKEREARQA